MPATARPSALGRRLARAGLVAAIALGAAPARGAPPPPARLEDLVPYDTFAFAAIEGGWARVADRARLAGLAAWLDDPEVEAAAPAFLGALRRALAALVAADGGPRGALSARAAAVLEAAGALEGQAAVAVLPRRPDGAPVLAALVDFGSGLRAFHRFLARLEEASTASGVAVRPVAGAGRHAWVLEVGGADRRVEVVLRGTAMLLSDDLAAVPEGAGRDLVLAGARDFVAARREVGGAEGLWFAWARRPSSAAAPQGGGCAEAVAQAVRGLDRWGIEELAAASVTGPAGTRDTLVVTGRGPGGLCRVLEGPAAVPDPSFRPLRSPSLRVDTSLGLGDAWTAVGAILSESGGDAARRWDAFRAEAARALRVEPEHLLAPFRGGASVWVAASPGGGVLPEAALVARLQDPASGERALARATEALAAFLTEQGIPCGTRTVPVAGTTLHLLEQDFDLVAPAWCVVDGRFVLAPSPHALRAVLDRRPGPVRETTPPDGLDGSLLVEADLERLLAAAWDTVVPLAQTLWHAGPGTAEADFDPALLPPARTMAPLWSGATARLAVRGDRLVLEVSHRWPVLPLVAAGAGLVWAAQAAETRAPPPPMARAVMADAPDAVAATRRALDQVAAAAREYAALQGALPARLADLVEQERLLPSVPVDGWGRALGWTRDGPSGAGEVRSAGADGRPRTEDDFFLSVPAP